MKKEEPNFLKKLFLQKVITASPNNHLAKEKVCADQLILKKLMLLALLLLFAIPPLFAQDTGYYTGDQSSVTIKTQQAPPQLPDYVQPICPGDGYIWTPGYWSWAGNDYYWVPGVWVLPPAVNLLWTPGYWGFYDSFYGWHPGYWGAQVGYYGGINYGFGYFGSGFYGGRWEGGHFMYNTSIWRVGKDIHHTYVNKVSITNKSRTSFNGTGGVKYRPNTDESRGIQNHTPASNEQKNHEINMSNEKGQFHHTNAKPAIHSMSAPGGHRFDERGHEMKQGRAGRRG
jgi:hypothetical protein